jgi:hypothetical protein
MSLGYPERSDANRTKSDCLRQCCQNKGDFPQAGGMIQSDGPTNRDVIMVQILKGIASSRTRRGSMDGASHCRLAVEHGMDNLLFCDGLRWCASTLPPAGFLPIKGKPLSACYWRPASEIGWPPLSCPF